MKAAVLGSIVTIGLLSALIVTACDDDPTHVFFGQAYEPTRDCLDTVSAIDTIGGEDTGQDCSPFCIATEPGQDQDAGVTVYVTTTCEPYPPLFDVSQDNPLCASALLAAKNQSTCLPDGGRSSNVPDIDAATPDDSGTIEDSGSD